MKTLVTVSRDFNSEFAKGDKITFAKDPQSPISKYFINAFLGNKKIGYIPAGKMNFGKDCIMAEEIYTKVPFNFSGTITNFKVVEGKNKIKTLFIEVEIDEKLKSKSKVKEEPKKENPSFADDIYEDFFKGSCRILAVDKSTGRLVDMKGKGIDEIVKEKLKEVMPELDLEEVTTELDLDEVTKDCRRGIVPELNLEEKTLYNKLLEKKKRKSLSMKVDFVQNAEKLINEDKVSKKDICNLFNITEEVYDSLIEMLNLNIKTDKHIEILALLPTAISHQEFLANLYNAVEFNDDFSLSISNERKNLEQVVSQICKQHCIDLKVCDFNPFKENVIQSLKNYLFKIVELEGQYFIGVFNILEKDYFEIDFDRKNIVFQDIQDVITLNITSRIINKKYIEKFIR